MTHTTRIYLLLCLLTFVFSGRAQDLQSLETATVFDHWYTGDTSLIDMKITTDLRELFRNPDKEIYQDATITTTLPDGTEESFEGKVRLRGNMRRQVCQIPPVKLKLKKKQLTERGWLPHNDLKLVLPCRETDFSTQDMIAEYLTYRMYEVFTPLSLRVQMVRIRFVDLEGKKDDREMLAFIIEPVETLTARFNLRESVRSSYRESFLEDDHYRKMAFFQYMIGNTDWNVFNGHNLKFVGGDPFARLVAIPYDFDYSAVVGTSYAVPHESLPIKSVTQRLYRGLSCDETEALALIEHFTGQEEKLLEPVHSSPYLDESKRKDMLYYLTGFFRQLSKTKSMVAELK